MLPDPHQHTVIAHWGAYRAEFENGRPKALTPISEDPDPSPIANGMIDALDNPGRILRPAVRRSFLEKGHEAGGSGRGAEPFVEVSWDEALALAAEEIDRVRRAHGNEAIYGGSYGWGSAGRFHHAQSQIHRFLNSVGGYVRSVQNYSFAAGDVILPHVVGDTRGLASHHSPWREVARHAKLILLFGGLPRKNSQVNGGGSPHHILRGSLRDARANGAEILNISPIRDDTEGGDAAEWMAIRPGTDVALMLGLAHALLSEGRADRDFLARHTTGFDRFAAYLEGRTDGTPKTPEWAAAITGIDAETIRALARRMAETRTMIMMSWSLQRAEHGEQPYWMAITLAAMLGQIGLPGGGYGFGYGSVNGVGLSISDMKWPSLPQGENAVEAFIPVARIADMLLAPGGAYDYNGETRVYPDIRLVYWAGGNPFHHHQDLNRLREAWRRPEVVIVNESWWNALARHADIVFPATTSLERNDIAAAARDYFIAASHKLAEPAGEARDDFAIFSGLAERLGAGPAFTGDLDEEGWLRLLYSQARQNTAAEGIELPEFDEFWRRGLTILPEPSGPPTLLSAFREDPEGAPLKTPSGRIEIFSETIDGFGYDDCPGHPTWLEPDEWLGAELAATYPLHLLSNQPATRLHSQYDSGSHSRASKIKGREPMRIHPEDAARRGIADGDIVRVFNARGACLAAAVLSDALRPGVVQLSTGAWFDPEHPEENRSLEKHGNPNVLTRDRGASRLSQGPSAQSCLVEIERLDRAAPEVTIFGAPDLLRKS